MSLFNKKSIVISFSGAASRYETAATVQHEVAKSLAQQILLLPIVTAASQPLRILEIGCGTGFLGKFLAPSLTGADWYFTDIAQGMVIRSRERLGAHPNAKFIVMDGEATSFIPTMSFDIICSSLAVQWFTDAAKSFASLAKLLAPSGCLVFSTLAVNSFQEWRTLAAEYGMTSGMPLYPSMSKWVTLLPSGHQTKAQEEYRTVPYLSGHDFLRDLKTIGAGQPDTTYQGVTPGALRRLLRATQSGFATTYHIAFICLQQTGC